MNTSQISVEKPSKSARKREMHALQALGEALVALNAEQLGRIDLPDALRDAVLDCQRITQREARRRQLQYIGRLMRGCDAAPIRAALDEIKGISAAAQARLKALERLRESLLADERAIQQIAARYPAADLQRLRQLRRNALQEQAQGLPPRAFQKLFRVLRELDEQ